MLAEGEEESGSSSKRSLDVPRLVGRGACASSPPGEGAIHPRGREGIPGSLSRGMLAHFMTLNKALRRGAGWEKRAGGGFPGTGL